MASRMYGVLQGHDVDVNNHGFLVGGTTKISKESKKGGPSGRKPLSDLSNSVKHTVSQISKKLNCDSLPIREEPPSSKVTGPCRKRVGPKASRKKASVGGRKVLPDISNSAKPHFPEDSRKMLKAPTRLGNLLEESTLHSIDLEEHFLHDHQECVKAQMNSIDLDEFLKVVGLHTVVDQPASPCLSQPKVDKLTDGTPLGALYLEEMTEQLLMEEEVIEDPSASGIPKSLAHCRTPFQSGLLFNAKKFDSVKFCLMETPLLSRKLGSSD